jgi:hypothetical protein
MNKRTTHLIKASDAHIYIGLLTFVVMVCTIMIQCFDDLIVVYHVQTCAGMTRHTSTFNTEVA